MLGRIRFGMVGGGDGAFIGAVHRAAARLDARLELVCGAFSSDATRSRVAATSLGLDPERGYPDFTTMMRREAARPAAERMEFVAIVTPNHLHYPVASEALKHGFHVLSDKPATAGLIECLKLRDEVADSGLLYGLTHAYAAYPLIIEARQRVIDGELGTIRKVLVEYTQGWLAQPVERLGNAQAEWRLDPARAGASGTFGDIGVHAFQLAEYVSNLRVTELSADLGSVVAGRRLDDDGAALLRFDNGARGVLVASQVSTGDENDVRLRVYGERASLEWQQQEPNTLWLKRADQPSQMLRAAMPYLGQAAAGHSRLPPGHPEGYIEAFANLYGAFGELVRAAREGLPAGTDSIVPGIDMAVRGMAFIEAAVAASASSQKWHAFPDIGR